MSRAIIDRDRSELEQRIDLAYPSLAGNLGRDELKAAVNWRTGRLAEAFALLRANPVGERTSRLSLLLRAAIALANGHHSEASDGLRRAEAGVLPTFSGHLRPWLDAEANILREQLVQGVGTPARLARSAR